MKMKKAGLVAILVLMGGLFLLNRSDVELVKQDALAVTTIGATGYELQSTLHFHNPNLLSSTIKNIQQKYYINGKQVAIMSMEFGQGIPGRKETEFPIAARFSRSDIQQFLPDSAVGTIKATVNITGEITFSNMFGGGKIPVNQTDSVNIPVQ